MSTPAKIPALTVKEVAKIRSLRKKGKSIKAIAKALHRSDKAIATFIKQDCPDCTPADKKSCNEKNCADKSGKMPAKKSQPKTAPKEGVSGVDIVKIPISEEQRKTLLVGFKLLAVADSIAKVLAEAFKDL